MRETIASASAERPTDSSQRGDSGSLARSIQTMAAPSEPATNIQRHPSMPKGCRGTRILARNPAAGTPMKPSV